MRPSPRQIRTVLAGLVALDLTLAVWGFFLPDLWFRFFHGTERVDPQRLLQRCAASWLAFLLVQLWALLRWERDRRWLAAVAGMRLGDALTDLTCLALASSTTVAAWVLFPVAGVGNLLLGGWLLSRAAERS
jgi:hypothetical protein